VAQNQTLGRAAIKYNGKILLTDKGAKLNLGGVERKPIVGDRVHGYAEEAKEPSIDCVISLTKGTDLEEIKNLTDCTVTFEGDIGTTWILKNAWSSVPLEVTAGEGGKVPVKFHAMSCVKM
jgi:hypothetical protein